MGMEASPWKMIEQAKEELQILELEHPDRFEYLKLDLKSFILLESQKLLSTKADVTPSDSIVSLPTSSTATTQASSSNSRKRKKGGTVTERIFMEDYIESSKHKYQKVDSDGFIMKKRDSVDMAIERAEACLRKIRDLKTSFL